MTIFETRVGFAFLCLNRNEDDWPDEIFFDDLDTIKIIVVRADGTSLGFEKLAPPCIEDGCSTILSCSGASL